MSDNVGHRSIRLSNKYYFRIVDDINNTYIINYIYYITLLECNIYCYILIYNINIR